MSEVQHGLVNNGIAKFEPRKKKSWSYHDLTHIKPLTATQETMFKEWYDYDHMCAYGTAGTGKTYISMYLALNEILRTDTPQDNIIIVRSVVPTREVGFLPGTADEKIAVYENPYRDICADLVGNPNTYDNMKEAGLVQFASTSFIRGLTWDNSIVIVDEIQNMSWSEIDSVITRVGENTRIILCGDDSYQNDLGHKSGVANVIRAVNNMKVFSTVKFTTQDIVRSDFVKSWIMTREELSL